MLSDDNVERPRFFFKITTIRAELEKVPMKPKFYTVRSLARLLGVTYLTIYREVSTGSLDAIKVSGQWRIPSDAVVHYLEKNHVFNRPDKF